MQLALFTILPTLPADLVSAGCVLHITDRCIITLPDARTCDAPIPTPDDTTDIFSSLCAVARCLLAHATQQATLFDTLQF